MTLDTKSPDASDPDRRTEALATETGSDLSTTTKDVQVIHHAVDALPGNVPAMFAVGDGRVDVLFSRAATVDEIVTALDPMYLGLSRTAMALHAVA